MKLDTLALDLPLAEISLAARSAEDAGHDGWFVSETKNDPFVLAALGAASTSTIEIGTNVAVAFARTPMQLAYTARDVQELSGGRFVLGLGSQVKAHVERRFAMPWSQPARRMHDFVLALRAIWHAWETGGSLDYRGEFYEHRLMTPNFAGTPHGFGAPTVGIAAVGPRMAEVAGEVGDLVLCNPFTTAEYVREVTLPSVAIGARRAGREVRLIGVSVGLFVVTGRSDEERAEAASAARERIAFYASTPSYRPVLDQMGLARLGETLGSMARRGEWSTMASTIDDDVLDLFALVVDDPEHVGEAIRERWGDVATRAWIFPTCRPDVGATAAIRRRLLSTSERS